MSGKEAPVQGLACLFIVIAARYCCAVAATAAAAAAANSRRQTNGPSERAARLRAQTKRPIHFAHQTPSQNARATRRTRRGIPTRTGEGFCVPASLVAGRRQIMNCATSAPQQNDHLRAAAWPMEPFFARRSAGRLAGAPPLDCRRAAVLLVITRQARNDLSSRGTTFSKRQTPNAKRQAPSGGGGDGNGGRAHVELSE